MPTAEPRAISEAGIEVDRPGDPLGPLRTLGLLAKVAELDAYGYTIVRPEDWDDHGLTVLIRDTLLAIAERETGTRPDLHEGMTHRGGSSAVGQPLWNLLVEGSVFEQAVVHEVPYALAAYLLGEDLNLSSLSAMIRGPGTPALELHTDMLLTPAPFATYAQVANISWALTDYTPDNGSTCFWPGSHKFCRQPTTEEMQKTDRFVPVTAPAGSLVMWHGNTWHGSFERKNPGLRMQLIMFYCRSYLLPQEWYRDQVSAEALGRHGARLHKLIGLDNPYPFARQGPDYSKLATAAQRSML